MNVIFVETEKHFQIQLQQENKNIKTIVYENIFKLSWDSIFHIDSKHIDSKQTAHSLNAQQQQTEPKLEKQYIQVVSEDTLDAAKYLIDEGYHPLVLNMASDFKPGGGCRSGAQAQEEQCCYRSNYLVSLDSKYRRTETAATAAASASKNDNDSATSESACTSSSIVKYPWKNPGTAVVSQGVTIFRESKQNNYAFLKRKEYFSVDFVAMSALRKPTLVKNNYTAQDRKTMFEKIEGMFKLATLYGHTCLLLSAFGCGAFANPPEEVAKIFSSVIKKYNVIYKEYLASLTKTSDGKVSAAGAASVASAPLAKRPYISYVCFAIFDSKRDNNFQIFYDKLDNTSEN